MTERPFDHLSKRPIAAPPTTTIDYASPRDDAPTPALWVASALVISACAIVMLLAARAAWDAIRGTNAFALPAVMALPAAAVVMCAKWRAVVGRSRRCAIGVGCVVAAYAGACAVALGRAIAAAMARGGLTDGARIESAFAAACIVLVALVAVAHASWAWRLGRSPGAGASR